MDKDTLIPWFSNRSKTDLFLLGFICACIIGRLFFTGLMTLTAPEAYYWEWSKDLAWGYFDHPPMIAYVIRFFTMLGGDTAFFIRIGALVLSILSTIVLYLLARDMFGKRPALMVCSVMQIIPFFAAGSIVSVPDAPLSFFWILTVYLVSRATLFNQTWFWYAAGVSFGLALMSKYHSSLLVPCILIYLFLSKNMRVWLFRKEPYLALLIGFLVFLPNLLWNIAHHATTFRFLLVERHGEIVFSIKGVMIFVAGFLVMMSPLFALVAVRFIPRIWRTALRTHDDRYLLLLSTSITPIIFFGLLSPFMHIGAHWVAVGYTTLCLAVISLLMERQPSGDIPIFKGFPLVSIVFSLIFVVGAHLFVAIAASIPPSINFAGSTYNLLISEKQKEFYGWEALRRKLKETVKSMPDPERTFFTSHGYRFASHLRFLVGATYQTRTTGLNKWKNQYAIWNDLESLKGWDAVFVEKDRNSQDPELLMKIFERVGPLEKCEIRVNHFKVRSFYIIRCFGYKARYIHP